MKLIKCMVTTESWEFYRDVDSAKTITKQQYYLWNPMLGWWKIDKKTNEPCEIPKSHIGVIRELDNARKRDE